MSAAKTAIVMTRETSGHQFSWGSAFAEGLKRHGWNARLSTSYSAADLFVLWGCRRKDKIERAKRDGAEVCVLERGYIADRFKWTSVSFGGCLNNRATFRGPFTDSTRWEKHFVHLMNPWREPSGGCVLIMGQVPGDTAVSNVDLPSFYARAATAFRDRGHADIRFREHPNASKKVLPTPLADDLARASCVVTWNSNSGVDAVLAGIPTVAMDPGSMAWDVTGHEFADPPKPDRAAWAHAIAWKQWSTDEIASGYCWDMVKG